MNKVKLNRDLTKYNEKLVYGLEGTYIINPKDGFFMRVKFPNIGTFKIISSYLDIVNEKHDYSLLKDATNIICTHGPKGGFKKLTFVVNETMHILEGSLYKAEAIRHLEEFKKYGLKVESRIKYV